jgi:plastocyanin
MTRASLAVCGLALALALATIDVAGCGGTGKRARGPGAGASTPPATHVVRLRKVAFDPGVVAAAPGDTMVWRNEDLVPHTVTARDGRWTSGNLPPDSTWRWVITGRDSAAYFCTYHTTMHGVIRITPRPGG